MTAFLTGLLLWLLPVTGEGGRTPDPRMYPGLVWYAEPPGDGEPVALRPDDPVNPASLVKLATSLWALEKLGPEFRFATRFAMAGTDLVVAGGADPDFHPENAMLVARALNDAGILRIEGRLLVDDRFWIGWEQGSSLEQVKADQRAMEMARRLLQAMDPRRWSRDLQSTWKKLAAREGFDVTRQPQVVISGGTGMTAALPAGATVVLTHRSGPLVGTLKRFNVWSNNDIQRLEVVLGGPDDLRSFLVQRWGREIAGSVTLATTSGLGSNRLTPRLAVRLLRDLLVALRRNGIEPADILPVAGCDPGTLKNFPGLADQGHRGAVVGKTGSLTHTDGGVALLAGIAGTRAGDLLFCVAAPGSGGHLAAARSLQESWLLEMMAELGGARPSECGAPVPLAGEQVELMVSVPAAVTP